MERAESTFTEPGGSPQKWREGVLDTLLVIGALLGAANVVIWLVPRSAPRFDAAAISAVASVALVVWLRLAKGLGFRFRVWAVLIAMYVVATLSLKELGFVTGPTIIMILIVGLSVTMLDRKAAVLWIVVALATFLGMGGLVAGGVVEPPDAIEAKLVSFKSWVTAGSSFAIMAGLLVITIDSVLRRAERGFRSATEALEQLKLEQLERERVDLERQRAEESLKQAQRLEGLGRLAGGVAHDFNNALLVIMSWVDLLRKDSDEEELEEGLDAILEAATQANQMTRQLLSFARRDASRAQRVRVDQFLRGTVKSLDRLLPDDIRVELSESSVPDVVIAEGQLGQILLNLAVNAGDAMPEGGVFKLEVTCVGAEDAPSAAPDRQRDYVEIRASDTGLGMEEGVRDHIFEPYFTTKSSGRGTGLGLASVYGLVTQNGGYIFVESTPGQGAAFVLGLPVAEGEVMAVPPADGTPVTGAGRTILLAEDNPLVCSALERSLKRAGFEVLTAPNGKRAIELARRYSGDINLLCMDAVMPGMTGRDLIRRFRELFPLASVLVCSGMVREELLERDIAEGEVEFLAKPFIAERLVERIGEVLGLGGR